MVRSVLFVLVLLSSTICSAHKFYMSITEMYYNEQLKSLEIIVKLFTDDIEKALEEKVDYKVFLGSKQEHELTDSLLRSYFNDHVEITENDKSLELEFLGKEVDQDYTWLYIEVPNFKANQKHKLKQTLLMDVFEEQKNQVNYKYQDQITTLDFLKTKTWCEF